MGVPPEEIDPDQQGGMAEGANPRNLGQLGDGMNRPFEQVVGPDGRIYIACRANYGMNGGGLARLDPDTDEVTVFRDEDQSVQAVASDSRSVYFGTSILGGRGSDPTTAEALFVIWDVEAADREFSCVPVQGAAAITSLATVESRGLVVGTPAPATTMPHAPATAFVFDLAQRQVIKTLSLCSPGTPLAGDPEAHGVVHITTARDGDVYGVAGRHVFKLDTGTLRVSVLDKAPIANLYQIVESPAEELVFFMAAEGHVLKYCVHTTPHYR